MEPQALPAERPAVPPAAGAPPPDATPDLLAAWPAMCPPVRARYLADGQSHRARALIQRWLGWRARSRMPGAPGPIPDNPRILAIQPDHLGGMLLTTPALRLLKAAWPQGEITVLAGPWAIDVPEHCQAVDRVLACPFPHFLRQAQPGGQTQPGGPFSRAWRAFRPYQQLLETAATLETERYHLAIVFHTDFPWGAALSALAGIPHRLGYAAAEAAPFLSRSLPHPRPLIGAAGRGAVPAGRHVAALGLALAHEALALAGRSAPPTFSARMAYEPSSAERAEAHRLWGTHELQGATAVVAIHPAPGAPAKRWPPQRFALLGDHLAGRYDARVVITGGPGDIAEAEAVASASYRRPVVLAGRTTFGVLAALLERCRFAVGTDNGALHLATARGVPTLRLFGPVDPLTWGSWAGPSVDAVVAPALACAPCHRLDLPPWEVAAHSAEVAYPCMRDVAVEQVIAAVEQLWSSTADRRPQLPR